MNRWTLLAVLAIVVLAGTARGGSDDQSDSTGVGGVGGFAAAGVAGTGGMSGIGGSTGVGACAMKTAESPPPSDGHGLTYDAARGVAVLVTGATRPGIGPTIVYELEFAGGVPVWYRRIPFGPVPSSRFAPGFEYDHHTGRSVLFGGNASAPDPPQPRDVWEWDGCRWLNRTPAWAPTAGWPAAPGVWPSSRWAPAMTYDWARERVIVTTGIQNPTFQWETDPADATVYEWNSGTSTFTARPPLGQPPTDRGAALAIGDRNRKLVYLVTGLQENESSGGGWDTSLYVWNGATGIWAKRTPAPAPSAREFAGIYHDVAADRIVVMGGTWYGWLWTPDYWQYDADANAFTLLVTDPPVYTPASGFVEMNRFWSPLAYDSRRQVAVQYGGRRASHTNCFFDCAPEMLADTRLIASGGVAAGIGGAPGGGPDAGAPGGGPDGGAVATPPLLNIALNPACPSGFPSPLESDQGWGGGALPCDVVDGQLSYDTWARGLAFTGGHFDATGGAPYIEPAGVRHAVIDFGGAKTFQKLTIWWHGIEYTPDVGTLEYWSGSAWVGIAPLSREYGARHEEGTNSGYADSDDYTFAPVTGSKVRYTFDNSGHNVIGTWNIHGWIYEIQVWTADQCATGADCGSGFCVDGVCCDSACGGGDPGDCQACSVAAGGTTDGTCTPRPPASTCRASAGGCDTAETCDGTTLACPPDALAPAGTICPLPQPVGWCSFCGGTSPACGPGGVFVCDPLPFLGSPCSQGSGCDSSFCVDGVCCESACGGGDSGDCQACSVAAGAVADGTCSPLAPSHVCRTSAGGCDVLETCDGVGVTCPADQFKPAGQLCPITPCTYAQCAGGSPVCPPEMVVSTCPPLPEFGDPLGASCSSGAGCDSGLCVDGVCCDSGCGGGATTDCLACSVAAGGSADGTCTPAAPATVCRPSAGGCDVAESCDGLGPDCPGDGFALAGMVCGVSTDLCTPDAMCSGADNLCPIPSPLPPEICAPAQPGETVELMGGADDPQPGGVSITFEDTGSWSGEVAAEPSGTGCPPPTGFQVLGSSQMPTSGHYWNIEATPGYPTPVRICIHYDQSWVTGSENTIRIVHGNLEPGGTCNLSAAGWTMLSAITVDTVNNIICGSTPSLSPFAIVEPEDVTPPVFAGVPGSIVAYATSTDGATVGYATPVATDDADGVLPVTCAPASGSTFAPGKTTVTCTASDTSGNPATATFTVWVQYQAPADGTFFLKPIRPDGSSRFRIGRAVPVKFQLAGASAGITSLVARLTVERISGTVRGTTDCEGDEDGEDLDMTFKYRKAKGLYAYRWKTRGESQGTYRLRADLGDGVVHEVLVSLRAPK